MLPRPHLAHVPRSLLCSRPPHHLPRRHRRLAAHGTTPLRRIDHRRSPHHRRFLPPELEHLPRNERGKEEEHRSRGNGVRV
jgi:hypothetical protein